MTLQRWLAVAMLAVALSCRPPVTRHPTKGAEADFTATGEHEEGSIGRPFHCDTDRDMTLIAVTTRGPHRLATLEGCVKCEDGSKYVMVSRDETTGGHVKEVIASKCRDTAPAGAECPVEYNAFAHALETALGNAGDPAPNVGLHRCGDAFSYSALTDDWRGANRIARIVLRTMAAWGIGDTVYVRVEGVEVVHAD